MSLSKNIVESVPVLLTFSTAIISSFYDFNKKWEHFLLALLGLFGIFLGFHFFTFDGSAIHQSSSWIDFAFNQDSLFISSLLCISLFMGIFPLRGRIEITSAFPYYLSFGFGIIFSNNLFTFFIFWLTQRSLPAIKYIKSMLQGESSSGGTYLVQHISTLIVFIVLLINAFDSGWLFSSFNSLHTEKLTWPVLMMCLIIIYESHGVFPFHSWVHDLVGQFQWYEISTLILSRAGVLLFVKMFLPYLSTLPDNYLLILLALTIFSSIYWTMGGIFETYVTKTATYFYIAQSSLVMAGLMADKVAARGAYLHLLVISLSGTAIWSLLHFVQYKTSIKRFNQFYGLAQFYPRTATLFCLFGFSMIGVPLGASFVVEDLVITGLLATHPFLGLGHVLATCLNGILFLLVFTKLFLGTTPFKKTNQNFEMDLKQMIPYVLVLFILFGLGLFPSLFLKALQW